MPASMHSRSSTGDATDSSAPGSASRSTGFKTSTATVAGIRALVDANGPTSATTTSPVSGLAAFFTLPSGGGTDARAGSRSQQQPSLGRSAQAGRSLGASMSSTALLPSFNASSSMSLGSSSTPTSAARVASAFDPNDPLSPHQGSEHGSSQDGSQGQEAASQDSFSSYIHKNAGIVASSSSQSSHGSHSRSPSSSPPRSTETRSMPAASAAVMGATGLDVVREEPQVDQALGWTSPSASTRSAALARHFAGGSSQPSDGSASSQHGSSPPPAIYATAAIPGPLTSSVPQPSHSVLADTSNNASLSFASSSSSPHFTDTSFAFSSVSHPHSMYAHEDNSMTTVGSVSDASIGLLDKAAVTSESQPRFEEHEDGAHAHVDLPASQETSSTSFVRQTSFRSFMGASWPDIVQAQNQAVASVLGPAIPIQARTIISKKRPRAAMEEASLSDADRSGSSQANASGKLGSIRDRVLTETDAVAELRSRFMVRNGKAGGRRSIRAKGRKSKNSKAASPSFEQAGFQGYRALTLNTSSMGRAVLSLRTRAYETVAVNEMVNEPAWGPLPLPSPPLDQDIAKRQLGGFRNRSVLEDGIPLQLRKSLRSTAELLAPHRRGEGEFIYGSMQEWAESEEPSSPPPESRKSEQLALNSENKVEHQGPSIFLSEQDKVKLYAGSTRGTPVSPLKPNPAALGMLKPPTPSKAQYVFSVAKYDNILGRSGNVAPLRCASAPGGISLRFKKCASAFTALRVVLGPLAVADPTQAVVSKRQYVTRGFCRTPSLDAVMQRGEVRDLDEGHAPAPTPPQKMRRIQKKKKAGKVTFIRASTPVASPSKRSRPAADEVDELQSQSEGESDSERRRSAPGSSLQPSTNVSSDEDEDDEDDDDDDDDEDEEDDAARFALSSDHYDYESSINGVPMAVRVKRRFGSAAPGYRGAFGMPNTPSGQGQQQHLTDADGFRRPGAPLGAGASGSAQRRSMLGVGGQEDGGEMQRGFSRSSSAGQMEGRREGLPVGAYHSGVGVSGNRSHGAFSGSYGAGSTRPSFSAERHGAGPGPNNNGSSTLTMGGDRTRGGGGGVQQQHLPGGGMSPAHAQQAYGWRETAATPGPRSEYQQHLAYAQGGSQPKSAPHGTSSFSRSTTLPSSLGPPSLPDRLANTSSMRGGFAGSGRPVLPLPPVPVQSQSQSPKGGWSSSPGPGPIASSAGSNSKKRPRPTTAWEEEQQDRHLLRVSPAAQLNYDENRRPLSLSLSPPSPGRSGPSSLSSSVSASGGGSSSHSRRLRANAAKLERVSSAPVGPGGVGGGGRVPLSSLANRGPGGTAAVLALGRRPTGDETAEQQHAAAELLLAFGQGRE
ncbi:unnamed protein product [Tilletia controversa]|nr:unnamed protein product [Tilletia caries]CAD6895824.1 unnamed protein product [Tilletia controversa]CAD6943147.1 unnamed protein product [Tilletia laevis]CAD6917079.1 unnamed protein product [Tilletia controversa]CAD6955688.1 unnamed protein product [Tilletia laevis]